MTLSKLIQYYKTVATSRARQTQTDRQTDRDRHTQTDRQTDRKRAVNS